MANVNIKEVDGGEVTTPASGNDGVELDTGTTSVWIKISNVAVYVWGHLTSLTAKTSLAGADQLGLADSAASNVGKKITWTNLVAQMVTDFTAASTTVAGKVELAITSEIDTASDDTRAMPPGQFRTSKFAVQRRQGVVGNPNSWYTNIRAQIVMFRTDAAITITRIHIHGADTSPTSELAGDLKFADDVNTGGFANATVIDVCDTTSGVFTATSSFDDATVPSGKYVYFQMDSAPHADWKDFFIEVHFTYD